MRTSFVNKSTIILSDKCKSVWGSSRKGKIYELQLVQLFYNKLIKEDRNYVFMDIGSNTGSFSLLPAIDKRLFCYSFEPNTKAYMILKENVSLNNIEEYVAVYNKGMWIREKTLRLKVPEDPSDSGLATFGDDPTRFMYDQKDGAFGEVKVRCDSIDNFVKERGLTIDAIKIDTEGAELFILKGGVNTLMSQRPMLLIEWDSKNTKQFGYEKEEILDFLETCGYTRFNVYKQSDMFVYHD